MSLDWRLSKVADHKTLCFHEDGSMSAVTRVIIFGLMAACVPSITARNWQEVARRFAVLQEVNGAFLTEWRAEVVDGVETGREVPTDRFVTADDVERHIGLETNATNETAARFNARMKRVAERNARNAQ